MCRRSPACRSNNGQRWIRQRPKAECGPACGQLMALLKKTPNPFVEALEQRIVTGSTQPWSVIRSAGFSRTRILGNYAKVEQTHGTALHGYDASSRRFTCAVADRCRSIRSESARRSERRLHHLQPNPARTRSLRYHAQIRGVTRRRAFSNFCVWHTFCPHRALLLRLCNFCDGGCLLLPVPATSCGAKYCSFHSSASREEPEDASGAGSCSGHSRASRAAHPD